MIVSKILGGRTTGDPTLHFFSDINMVLKIYNHSVDNVRRRLHILFENLTMLGVIYFEIEIGDVRQ